MGKVGRFLCDPIRAIQCALAERRSKQDEKKEALALLHACESSRLAALTSHNSSTTHLLASRPPSPPIAESARPPPRTMRSATLVHVVSHTTLRAAPAGSPAQRPPLISQGSTRSILKSSICSVPTPECGTRRNSRMGSVVSWTVPSLSQIGEDGTEHSSLTAVDATSAGSASSPSPIIGGVQGEEDRIIGGALVRVRTKVFRRVNYSSGEEEFEEILLDGCGKQVILVWGPGVDDIIT